MVVGGGAWDPLSGGGITDVRFGHPLCAPRGAAAAARLPWQPTFRAPGRGGVTASLGHGKGGPRGEPRGREIMTGRRAWRHVAASLPPVVAVFFHDYCL